VHPGLQGLPSTHWPFRCAPWTSGASFKPRGGATRSRCGPGFPALLALRLRVQKFFFLLQESAVASPHPKNAVGINRLSSAMSVGNVFQKIAVGLTMTLANAALRQQCFEPFDSARSRWFEVHRAAQCRAPAPAPPTIASRFCHPRKRRASTSRSSNPARREFQQSVSHGPSSGLCPVSWHLQPPERTLCRTLNLESCST